MPFRDIHPYKFGPIHFVEFAKMGNPPPEFSQDLIDAVRKIISRVPPSSGGKRPENNAALWNDFRHETCLPATWPPLHPHQRLCKNVGTATTMCKKQRMICFVSSPRRTSMDLTFKVLNNPYTHLPIYKSQQGLFAQPPPDVRSGIILRLKRISLSHHLLPNWGLSHQINVFWIDSLLIPPLCRRMVMDSASRVWRERTITRDPSSDLAIYRVWPGRPIYHPTMRPVELAWQTGWKNLTLLDPRGYKFLYTLHSPRIMSSRRWLVFKICRGKQPSPPPPPLLTKLTRQWERGFEYSLSGLDK